MFRTYDEILESANKYFAEKPYVKKPEVAGYMDVSLTTINNFMKQEVNPLKSIKFGIDGGKATVRFIPEDIARFIYENNNSNSKEVT